MPFLHYPTKRAARKAQRLWLLGVAKFEIISRILEPLPGSQVGCVTSGVIAVGMGYLAVEAGAAADDPPRRDYKHRTHAVPRRLPRIPLDTEVERVSYDFSRHATQSAAHLSALVRAVERSQGAEAAADFELIPERVFEADRNAVRAAVELRSTSESGSAASVVLQAELEDIGRSAFRRSNRRELLDTPYWEKLGARGRRIFEEASVDPRALSRDWDPEFADDPMRSAVASLRSALSTAVELADALELWGPSFEPSEPPDFWEGEAT